MFREEIAKHYVYWHSHPYESGTPRKKIERIILAGRGANMKGMGDYFASALGVPVVNANPWSNSMSAADFVPDMQLADALGYTAAIGLALRTFDETGKRVIRL